MSKSNVNIFWITGLSGSGKSTISKKLTKILRNQNNSVIMLDGDELRKIFNRFLINNDNYDIKHRLDLAMSYANLCKEIASQGVNVVISTISLFHEIHRWNRKNLPGYIEIFLDTPIEELKKRDTKQLYQRFDNGKISNIVGLDIIPEYPLAPDVNIKFHPKNTVDDIIKQILDYYILKRGSYEKFTSR